MRTRLAAILLAGAAALAFTGSAVSSSATTTTTTWTVTPGGNATGMANEITLTDATSGSTVSCPDYDYPYFHHHGPNPYGTINSFSLGTCTGPLGLTLILTPSALPWDLNGTSYNPTTGVTAGTVTGIHATLSGSSCSLTIDGTSSGADNGEITDSFSNSTNQLDLLTSGGNLHVYNVSGCFGLFSNGDGMTMSASYTLSPAQVITSP
jgi:hypothetical protein